MVLLFAVGEGVTVSGIAPFCTWYCYLQWLRASTCPERPLFVHCTADCSGIGVTAEPEVLGCKFHLQDKKHLHVNTCSG